METTLIAKVKQVVQTQRKSPRVPFMNTAMVWDCASEANSAARVNDLSSGGCYLDTANPLPVGTLIRLNIVRSGEKLLAYATVVYATPNLGMGVCFTHIASGGQEVLSKWLSQN